MHLRKSVTSAFSSLVRRIDEDAAGFFAVVDGFFAVVVFFFLAVLVDVVFLLELLVEVVFLPELVVVPVFLPVVEGFFAVALVISSSAMICLPFFSVYHRIRCAMAIPSPISG